MKKWLSVCLIGLLMCSLTTPALANETSEQPDLAETARAAILIERDSGSVLYEKNPDTPLPPASMTKIMTMLLIMEALEKKQISLDDKVPTSEYAASMGGSQVFLEPGEEMTVKQMLYAISVGSANDACVAMAEKLSGSEKAFVAKMNQRAKELGLKNTKFLNCTGLPAGKEHYSSARDMALMGKALLAYPEITEYTGTYEAYLREDTDKKFWLVNTNKLVKFYPGVDGLKTGFTQESKYCLTATAVKEDMRTIAVVFGAESPKERNAQVIEMLDYGFNQYTAKKVYKKNQTLATVPIEKGSQSKVDLVAAEDISILSKKSEADAKVSSKMVVDKNVQAPIAKGQALGKITVSSSKGKIISETKLVSLKAVPRASWFQSFKKAFGTFTKVNLRK